MIKEWIFRRDVLVMDLTKQIMGGKEKLDKSYAQINKLHNELNHAKQEILALNEQKEKIRQTIAKEKDLGLIILRLWNAVSVFAGKKHIEHDMMQAYNQLLGSSGRPIPYYPFGSYK